MEMTDGVGERIRRIMRLGNALKREEHAHHLLNLMLVDIAVTDDRLLDESRAVFMNLQACSLGYEQSDAAHLPELERDLHIRRVEGFLDRAHIRLKARYQSLQPVADFQKPQRESLARRSLDRAVFDETVTAAIAFDDTPPRRLASRINP